MSLNNLLYADAFVNNSIEVQGGHQDRINTILNETFQLTIRQHIYNEDDNVCLGDFKDDSSPIAGPFSTANKSKPLLMRKKGPGEGVNTGKNGVRPSEANEQLSAIDEEEEKRMANAFTEVKRENVYRAGRGTVSRKNGERRVSVRGLGLDDN